MEAKAHFSRSEIKCVELLPALPLWIIEYAWSRRMVDLLKVLGSPLWLEGDWSSLTLSEACSVRAAAAEAWSVLRARDVEHYERATEFLQATHRMLPHLVSSIKHMKIVFGFRTLVIMWMIQKGHCPVSTVEKTMKFFPSQYPQYSRCPRRHMELMRKNAEDFRDFAVSLARNEDIRQAYIRNLMEEQYGEQYAQKLEERLDHYLQQLESALPQQTCLDQVLRREWPMTEGEELLLDLVASTSNSFPVTLERLLQCALLDHSSLSSTPDSPLGSLPLTMGSQNSTIFPITLIHSQQNPSHGSTSPLNPGNINKNRNRNSTQKLMRCLQEPPHIRPDAMLEGRLEKEEEGSEDLESPLLLEEDNSDKQSWDHSRGGGGGGGGGGKGGLEGDWSIEEVEEIQGEEPEEMEVEMDRRGEKKEKKKKEEEEEEEGVAQMEVERMEEEEECEGGAEDVVLVSGDRQMCSTHHKWMRSILQECSEELLFAPPSSSPLQLDTPTFPPTQLGERGPSQDPPGPTLASTPKKEKEKEKEEAEEEEEEEEAARDAGCLSWQSGASISRALRISPETQSLLIRSALLQPVVLLTRLPPQDRGWSVGGADESVSWSGEEEEEDDEDEQSVSANLNYLLYESSESELDDSDPDYVP